MEDENTTKNEGQPENRGPTHDSRNDNLETRPMPEKHPAGSKKGNKKSDKFGEAKTLLGVVNFNTGVKNVCKIITKMFSKIRKQSKRHKA